MESEKQLLQKWSAATICKSSYEQSCKARGKCGLNGPGGMFYLYLLFIVTVAMLNGWQEPLDIILKADMLKMIQANFKLTPCCQGRCQKYENLGTDGK